MVGGRWVGDRESLEMGACLRFISVICIENAYLFLVILIYPDKNQ